MIWLNEMRFLLFTIGLCFIVFANAEETTAPITPDDTIRTESITDSTVNSNSNQTTTLKSPPASAITPTINTSNSDLCTFGVAGGYPNADTWYLDRNPGNR